MPQQHIVAIGGGGLTDLRGRRPLLDYVVSLSGKTTPRICYIGTAMGDDPRSTLAFYDAVRDRGWRASHLALFSQPNVRDPREHLLAQDVIYVGGGSVANLLAVWRVHGLDTILREAWEAGVVLCGTSAGSLCWFEGGCTDSFGPELRPITNGLGFLAASNAPHYDSEPQRRPLFQRLVREGVVPAGWAADDYCGLHFEGTTFARAVAATDDARAWRVEPDGETEIKPERL